MSTPTIGQETTCQAPIVCVVGLSNAADPSQPRREISSSSKSQWGGPRVNSGGPRANSGGPRPNAGGPRPNSGGYRPGAGRKRKPLADPPPLLVPQVGSRWYVVEVRHHQDFAVAAELYALGVPHILALRLVPERPARRRTEGLRPLPPVPAHYAPVFPRYLFAAFDLTDPVWRIVAASRDVGVRHILGSGPERPTPIPDAAIERLQAQADGRGVILPPEPPQALEPIQKGAVVRYAGLSGICRWSSRHRVGVDLETGMRVQVARALVEVV